MINNFKIFIVFLFCLGCSINQNFNEKHMKTVAYVDLEKFMGDWYVIANIPTFLEKGATNSIESYSLNEKGEIETTFSFYQDSPQGKLKTYRPKAFIFNKKTNAEWRMQFLWPFKLPFLIVDLADDYRYTVIGYPSKKYVWIMAREPKISNDDYSNIINKLKELGYNTDKIKKIIQDWE